MIGSGGTEAESRGARARLIAGGIGLLLLLGGGVAFVTGIVHLPIRCEGPPSPWGDFDRNPYGRFGIQVADLTDAAPYLAFTPTVPRALGPASKLFIGGNKPDMSARLLVWLHVQPPYGRFWIEESVTEMTQVSIDSLNRNPTGCSLDSVVTLRGGTRAALMVGNPAAIGSPGTTSIMWLDHGLLISAIGPMDTFTKDHAIAVANHF
jgi:hypothetical protein